MRVLRVPVASASLLTTVAVATGTTDVLNPGGLDVTSGAAAQPAPVNRRSSSDNGNDVIQCGVCDDRARYTLQVGFGRASCRVRGDRGAVEVGVPAAEPGCCTLAHGATADTVTRALSGPVGALTYPASLPLTVDGKLTAGGAFAASADQFNGRIDRAHLTVG